MTVMPDVLCSPASPLRQRLEGFHWGSLSHGPLEGGVEVDMRPHVLVLSSTEAENVWSQIESQAADAPVFPIIVGDQRPIAPSAAPLLRLAPKDRWLVDGVRPEDYSSTGQANVLALSVFLGLALRQTFAQNRFVLLDEPVQNLDDLHFLAFITLIKRIALSRQVIVSTADSNIAEVLRRQLRSWSGGSRRWCEYEWVGFDPVNGPAVKRRESQKIAVA